MSTSGGIGIAEHPRKSRAWSTKAFKKMQGFDTHAAFARSGPGRVRVSGSGPVRSGFWTGFCRQFLPCPTRPSRLSHGDPFALNKALWKRIGGRAVDHVQRLHKNLGHPSSGVLEKMLSDVQASSASNVLEAAKNYVCPACYARKPSFQNPPASSLKCPEFNDPILVDSHWIQCEDSIIKRAEPAPGTSAHKRREKNKAEKAFSGRQCVLAIIDNTAEFCSVRILKSERADEFIKG